LATKISSFIANYERKLRMRADIKKKEKVKKVMEFVKRMNKMQKEAEAALKKEQENMKRQVDKRRKKSKE